MPFKKGPAQAKPDAKGGPQAGKKAPPPKKPLAAKDDDDVEDDDDFSMDEESDFSGADEDLDDEELDDEELDDEELDDEDLDEDVDEESEDEDVPAGKAATAKAGTQQQKSPNKEAQTPKQKVPVQTTNGKRKVEGAEIASPSKKIRLEEHIPASFVLDYESRDLCDVKLTSFADGVTMDDVKALCKDAVEVRDKFRGKKLVCAFMRFASKEKATSAVQALQKAKLKGNPVAASYCGERWTNPTLRPAYLADTLDVRRVPKQYQNRKMLAPLFPTGVVVKTFSDGYAQVKFPSSEALIKALKNPKCRTIDGQNLQFSMAVLNKDRPAKLKASGSGAKKLKGLKAKKAAKQEVGAKSPVKGLSPGKKPGTPGPQNSPKTPGQQQQQKGPKTPGQQKGGKTPGKEGGPKTPGQPKGGPKTPKEGQKATPKGTPFQKKMPGLKGTPKLV